MQIFVAVCDSNSVTEAAHRLFMAQSAVSLVISELEKHYGVKFFDRISRRLHLTDAGKYYLSFARRILESFDEMEKKIQNWDDWGLLRIGSSITIGTYLLPQLATSFYEQFPNIKMHVLIDQSSVIEQKLLKNELDAALIEGMVHSDRIVSHSLMNDELVLICGKDSRLRQTPQISLDQLREQPFILREKGSGTRELFDSVLLTRGLLIAPIWESISTEAIINAVAAGIGLSVLPLRLVERELASGRLFQIKIEHVDFKRQFYLIYHQDKFISGSIDAFIQHCIQSTKGVAK